MQYTVFYDFASQFEGKTTYAPRDPSTSSNTHFKNTYKGPFSWSSEMLTYYTNVAGAFWVRRMVDGSSDDFVEVLKKLLKTYDSDWLENASEAKRFPFPAGFKEL